MIRRKETLRAVLVGLLLLALTGSDLAAENMPGSAKIKIGKEQAVYLQGKELTLAEAIRMAIESNYDLMAGAYELAMLDSDYKSYQLKYSPFLNAEAGGQYQEYPGSTSLLIGTDQKIWLFSAALAKRFPTGTQVSLAVAHERAETTLANLTFDLPGLGPVAMPAFGDSLHHRPSVYLSLKQDLLQNSFGFAEQREQRQIVNAALIQKDLILYQLSGSVVKVVMDYWNVVLKESAMSNTRLQLEETKAVRDITARNVDLGLTNRFQLHYYNTLVAGAEVKWMMARQAHRDAKRNFMQAINLDDETLMQGQAVLVDQLPDLDREKALATAYAKRADYLSAKRMLEQAQWELEIAENMAWPGLTAELTANLLSQQPNIGDAYEKLFVDNTVGYAGKLTLTYPLGNPLQEVKERNARFMRKQARVARDKYERKIKDDIESQIEQIQTLHKVYQTTRRARREAEKFYERMLAQMRYGRLNASLVKNGVDALAGSRQAELEMLIQFNVIHLQFIVTQNALFETFGIDPEKYIPKE